MTASTEVSVQHIILALDIGSSSIRCTPYEYETSSNNLSKTDEEQKQDRVTVEHVKGCQPSVTKISSVQPNSGKIILSHVIEEEQNSDSKDTIAPSSSSSISLFDTIDRCIDETLSSLRVHFKETPFQIVGVAISTFVMNLIGVDEKGKVIDEDSTMSYACNSPEVVKECTKLKEELGEQKLHELYQRTGTPMHNAYALSQLRVYYNQRQSSSNQKVQQWLTIASILISRWIGHSNNFHIPISFSEASWTGLFNFRCCKWDEKCLELLPSECRNSLPKVADFTTQHYMIQEYILGVDDNDGCVNKKTRIRNPYWERWPELRDENNCTLFLGIGDGIGANIGSKCLSPARYAVTIGTSAAARICLPLNIVSSSSSSEELNSNTDTSSFIVPYGLFCYRIDKSNVLLGGALTDGGSIISWLRNLLNLNDNDDFASCIEKVDSAYSLDVEKYGSNNTVNASNNSLDVIPFFSGERSTGYRGGATGCMLGLTRDTTAVDMLRSCLESIVLRINAIIGLIDETKTEYEGDKCIVASGNALEQNILWRQMLADCSGMKVVKDEQAQEGTSRGVGLLVAYAIGGKVINNGITEEKLVIGDEQIPNLPSASLWSSRKNSQETAINCVSDMWKQP